jgi:hypothetical protein
MRVGIPNSRERVVALPCEVSWEIEDSGCVCVASLQLEGFRGKKITPIFGWKVSLKSH